jgi:hypothetical protein
MVFNHERIIEKIEDPRRRTGEKHFLREEPWMHRAQLLKRSSSHNHCRKMKDPGLQTAKCPVIAVPQKPAVPILRHLEERAA